jgi:2-keto-4-pentenoate hydratase
LPAGSLGELRLAIRVAGRAAVEDVDPRVALGDLADVVRALADQLPLADDAIRAGDVVITGSAVPALALAGGEEVEVDVPALGERAAATVRIAARAAP